MFLFFFDGSVSIVATGKRDDMARETFGMAFYDVKELGRWEGNEYPLWLHEFCPRYGFDASSWVRHYER